MSMTRFTEATTSDFPDSVGDDSNVEREMIRTCSFARSNWKKIVRTVPLGDFKPVTRLRRSDTDKYLLTIEGAEHLQGG